MKITVGVKSRREAEYFLSNGADEIYCGLVSLRNNRLPRENFSGPEDLKPVLELARGTGRKVFVAVNELLRETDYPQTLRQLAALKEMGVNGAIVRDPALLAYFKKKKFKFYFTLSTLANCFNSKTLGFFAGLGLSRVVLPMQMMPENAEKLIKNRYGLDTEVFCQALYYGVNLDSLCTLPCPQTSENFSKRFTDFTCLLPYACGKDTFRMPMPPPEYMFGAFYDYYHMGAGHAKVARWPNVLREIDLFLKIRKLVKLLDKNVSRKMFIHEGLRLDAKPLQYGKSFTLKSLRG
jgi:hypothetical protein